MAEHFKSVKVKLKTIVKDPNSITIIQNTVNTIHDLTTRTYQFIKAYCLYCFHEDLELPILNAAFIKNCFVTVGLKGKQGPKSTYTEELFSLESFRNQHFNYPQVDIRGIAGLLKYQATEMETCYENNIWIHFIKRLQKYIRFTIPQGSKTETRSRVRQILKALKEDDISLMPESLENWFIEHRNLILSEAKDWYKHNLEFDLEKNPFRYLWYMINMELQLELKNIRTFSVFPLRNSEIPKHILLDTEFFAKKLLSKKDKHLTKGKQYISRNRVLIAKAVFNFKKKVFNRKRSEDEFLNKVKEKFGNKVLAYGDWKGSNFLKNQTSSLGIGMKKLLARKFKIFSVDEFRSSKLHSLEGCNHPLENESKGGVKKHRLLVCSRCSQQNVISQRNSNYFVNRDVNAATNILQLGKLSLRNLHVPFCFQRKTKWEEVKSSFQPLKAIQIPPKS
jgi:hypothetical protein